MIILVLYKGKTKKRKNVAIILKCTRNSAFAALCHASDANESSGEAPQTQTICVISGMKSVIMVLTLRCVFLTACGPYAKKVAWCGSLPKVLFRKRRSDSDCLFKCNLKRTLHLGRYSELVQRPPSSDYCKTVANIYLSFGVKERPP